MKNDINCFRKCLPVIQYRKKLIAWLRYINRKQIHFHRKEMAFPLMGAAKLQIVKGRVRNSHVSETSIRVFNN